MLTVRKATVKEWRKELDTIDRIINLIETKQLETDDDFEYDELDTLLREYSSGAEKIRKALNETVIQIEF